MSYYKLLGLEREPFSTSPDPYFFYESEGHRTALHRLLIEIRLKRGLSVVLGDVGTGKTTLSRRLFQYLRERKDIIFHMILDPSFPSEEVFLEALIRAFHIKLERAHPNILDYKEAVERFLFLKAAEEGKTVVLLIDEAQKLSNLSLEILRVLLNFETNEYKLLQLVLLAQLEFLDSLARVRNLWDRVSLKYVLNPLDEVETKKMILFRLRQAGYRLSFPLFTDEAIAEIYRRTQGYPRRISLLCHNALKYLVMKNIPVVNEEVVWRVIDIYENFSPIKTYLGSE